MNIFNSLGSNYNFSFILKTILSGGSQKNKEQLEHFLENKYKGKVTFLYKGREALELGLRGLNLPRESFVAINGFTCFAVFEAVKKAGLNIEYLDIEKGELNFTPQQLEKHVKENSNIKAVIVQNTLGYPCKIEQIARICQAEKLILIEDLAHCVGTRYENGQAAGIAGDLVILSFSQDKMIDGISGGALIQKDDSNAHLEGIQVKKQLIDKLYPFFTYVIRNTYSVKIGKILHFILKSLKLLSSPMDKLDNQLHKLPVWYCKLINTAFAGLTENLAHRKKIASTYVQYINPKVISPKISSAINLSTNLRFPVFVNNRRDLIEYLKRSGIYVSDIWYDGPIAPKKYLLVSDYKTGVCPNAELAAEEILNLPTHQGVSEKTAPNIAQLINQWLKLQ